MFVINNCSAGTFSGISSLFKGGSFLWGAGPRVQATGLITNEVTDEFGNVLSSKMTGQINTNQDVYKGVRGLSQELISNGVPRANRLDIVNSFQKGSITQNIADDATYGLRFYDNINAYPKGGYLFETFSPSVNRSSLALPSKWNLMTDIKQWQVRPGAKYFSGIASPQLQFGNQFTGGAKQWFTLTKNLR